MRQLTLLAGACVLGMCLVTPARANLVSYNISNSGGAATDSGYAYLEEVNVNIDNNQINNAFTGGIKITEVGGPVKGLPTSYITVCTDIQGTLYLGSTYTYDAPAHAFNGSLSGIGPSWGANNGPGVKVNNQADADMAIQNAAYLFNNYGKLTSGGLGGTAEQMAALQLAVWEALYDTTLSGQVTVNSSSRFKATSTGTVTSGNVISDAATLINTLNGLKNEGNFGISGYLLNPDPATKQGDGEPPQELLLPVPEPSTIVVGALALLPFGAGVLRSVRKSRAS